MKRGHTHAIHHDIGAELFDAERFEYLAERAPGKEHLLLIFHSSSLQLIPHRI